MRVVLSCCALEGSALEGGPLSHPAPLMMPHWWSGLWAEAISLMEQSAVTLKCAALEGTNIPSLRITKLPAQPLLHEQLTPDPEAVDSALSAYFEVSPPPFPLTTTPPPQILEVSPAYFEVSPPCPSPAPSAQLATLLQPLLHPACRQLTWAMPAETPWYRTVVLTRSCLGTVQRGAEVP